MGDRQPHAVLAVTVVGESAVFAGADVHEPQFPAVSAHSVPAANISQYAISAQLPDAKLKR